VRGIRFDFSDKLNGQFTAGTPRSQAPAASVAAPAIVEQPQIASREPPLEGRAKQGLGNVKCGYLHAW
jgi:hypothetical protein